MTPEILKTPAGLLSFVESIPANEFCAYTRNNFTGQHCILGQVEKHFPDFRFEFEKQIAGIPVNALACVNNHGNENGNWYDGQTWDGKYEAGEQIKTRLVNYLSAKV